MLTKTEFSLKLDEDLEDLRGIREDVLVMRNIKKMAKGYNLFRRYQTR